MRRLSVFIYAVLAGVCISIGGAAFLSIENKVVGALFFTVGLFTIVTFGMNLYTGKVCYVFERDKAYALDLPVIWLGNLVGTYLTGTLLRLTRVAAVVGMGMSSDGMAPAMGAMASRACSVCDGKLGDNLLSIFILAVFCNILIFIAVDGFNKNEHQVGKYLALFFGVAVFIVCGFEHCVANMFYFTVAGAWSWKTLLYVIVMTLGNSVGGVIFPLLRQLKTKLENKAKVAAK